MPPPFSLALGISMRFTLLAALLGLTLPALAQHVGLGGVHRVDASRREISITTDAEENFSIRVPETCRITLNGKPAKLSQLLKWDRVLSYKKDPAGALRSLDIARSYDEARIGKVELSSGTFTSYDESRGLILVRSSNGKYEKYSITPKTQILWFSMLNPPYLMNVKELEPGDELAIKQRFYFPVREALEISVKRRTVNEKKEGN